MKSPHEGPTTSRMSLRRPRGPYRFIVTSLAKDLLSRDRFSQGRKCLPMVSFSRKHYRIPIASSAVRQRGTGWRGPISQRGLLSSRGALAQVPPLATPLAVSGRRSAVSVRMAQSSAEGASSLDGGSQLLTDGALSLGAESHTYQGFCGSVG